MGGASNYSEDRDWEAPEEAILQGPDSMAAIHWVLVDAGADISARTRLEAAQSASCERVSETRR